LGTRHWTKPAHRHCHAFGILGSGKNYHFNDSYIADCERVEQFINYANNLFYSLSKYKLNGANLYPIKRDSLGHVD
jgi:hypothetical protein